MENQPAVPGKRPWYLSVEDPGLSLMVKGMLTSFVPVLLGVLKFLGHEIAPADAQNVIDGICNVLSAISLVVSAVVAAIGAGRKIYYKYFLKTADTQNPFGPQ